MSAAEIIKSAQKTRQTWRSLWWRMGGGTKSEYERIKGTDIFEFFPLFDLWQDAIKKQKQDHQTITKRNGRK